MLVQPLLLMVLRLHLFTTLVLFMLLVLVLLLLLMLLVLLQLFSLLLHSARATSPPRACLRPAVYTASLLPLAITEPLQYLAGAHHRVSVVVVDDDLVHTASTAVTLTHMVRIRVGVLCGLPLLLLLLLLLQLLLLPLS